MTKKLIDQTQMKIKMFLQFFIYPYIIFKIAKGVNRQLLIMIKQQYHMKIFIILTIFLLLCLNILTQRTLQQFEVNLDLPPRQRYKQLSAKKKSNINRFIDYLYTTEQYKRSFKLAHLLSPFLKSLIGTQFYEECQGIAQSIGRKVSELIVFNYMYELGAYQKFCTSISVQTGPGDYFLARNLDYGFEQFLADNSIKITYTKGSQPIFQTVGHAGFNGAHTGLRFNGYSLTLNQRIDGGLHKTLEEILFKKSSQVSYLLLQTLRTCGTIEQAMRKLTQTRIAAAIYFIVNAPNRNIVIERQRKGAKAIYENRDFLVQTNTDRQLPDPDTRRDIAQSRMKILKDTNKLTREGVWNVLTSPPNKNKLTLITVLLDTKNNKINATVWY